MSFGLTGKVSIGIVGTIGTLATGAGIYQLTKGPSTLGELLSKTKGFKLLEEDSKWDALVTKYKSTTESQGTNPKKIEGLQLTNQSSDNLSNKNREELKSKCKDLWDTKISSENQDRQKEEIENWCIVNAKALSTSVA